MIKIAGAPTQPSRRTKIEPRRASRAAEGVSRTRRMRAEVRAMPNEDAAMVAARVGSWNDSYRPRSPAAQHLVNECVAATLLSDRCRRAYDSAVADQVDEVARGWERERNAMVDETWKGLAS